MRRGPPGGGPAGAEGASAPAPAGARPFSAAPALIEREGSPRQGLEQLYKRAMMASAGGSLVVRYHTGRVVPAWFATPSGYSMEPRPQSAAPGDGSSGAPDATADGATDAAPQPLPPSGPSPADPSPRGTLQAQSKRGPPRGSAPPTSRHLSIGFGEFGRTPAFVGAAARRAAQERKKPKVRPVSSEFATAKGEKLLREVQALLD